MKITREILKITICSKFTILMKLAILLLNDIYIWEIKNRVRTIIES